MEFYEDGDYIVSTWHPGHNYQGWVDTMHGGILSTLIDEVCGWVVTRKLQTSGYTVQLNVKFRKAVPTTEPELTIRAKVTKQVRNLAYISAEITNSKGELCNEGEALHPETEVWETCTPYFDRRNIHFYINRLGFHAVEFFNEHHPDPHMPEQFDQEDGLFNFEKRMK